MNAPKAKATPTITTVKMDDERVVDFVGKRKLQKDSIMVDGKPAVRMDFLNGETRTFTIPEALFERFAQHGAEQKLGDELAGLEDVDDCVLAIDELMDRLNRGEWGQRRESNGMAGTSILARALVEHSGKAIEAVRAFLAGKSHAEKVALRQNQAIKPIVEKLEAEKASRSKGKKEVIDTDTMLDALA